MFFKPAFKTIRFLLFPLAFVYWAVVAIRNWLYDRNISKSSSFALPVICVGNLSVGGTGKSPMVEYLIRLLQDKYRVATLSRGYKRKTKGYALAGADTTALEIGDEPMQFHQKFPDVAVAVGEERLVAIPQLLHDRPETDVIILDDAFQHRAVRAGLNILLTDFNHLFTRDFYLPTGDLRDMKSSYKRADIVVVTKANASLGETEAALIKKEINPLPHQDIFFATTVYGRPYHLLSREERDLRKGMGILMVTGIANPAPLEQELRKYAEKLEILRFSDHHIFTIDDLKMIRKNYQQLNKEETIIITTEKDAVRLLKFQEQLADLPFYILPVQHALLFQKEQAFANRVLNFIDTTKNNLNGKEKQFEEEAQGT